MVQKINYKVLVALLQLIFLGGEFCEFLLRTVEGGSVKTKTKQRPTKYSRNELQLNITLKLVTGRPGAVARETYTREWSSAGS